MTRNKNGFTLIELIIVVIIIGILASIAAPMMKTMKNRAIVSEAATGLGTLRNILRNYYAEHQQYPTMGGFLKNAGVFTVINPATLQSVGINADDFEGVYFPAKSYYIFSDSLSSSYSLYCIMSTGSGGTENYIVSNNDTKALSSHSGTWHRLEMNMRGQMKQTGLVDTGYTGFFN